MSKIVFFGSSEYSVIVLKKLLPIFSVVLVVTKTDKPAGRLQIITPNPIAQFAIENKLPLLQIEEFSQNYKLEIRNYRAQLGLCVAFGPPFFDQEMIDLFPYKIVNIHPSPLPKYRGATPGPWQIINGETTSAITFFQIDPLPDHGPIISTLNFPLSPTETAASFYQKAFELASNNIETVLNSYLTHPDALTIQDHSQRSYFPKLNKELAQIDWSWDTAKIERFIRAMTPWPIAWTYITDFQGNIFKMKVISAEINGNKLELKNVQIEGKKPTFWPEISKYYKLKTD